LSDTSESEEEEWSESTRMNNWILHDFMVKKLRREKCQIVKVKRDFNFTQTSFFRAISLIVAGTEEHY